jgi:hypothetical protein
MRALVFIALAALGVGGCSNSNPAKPSPASAPGSTDLVLPAPSEQQGGRPIVVAMTGAAERPGPGDPDGTGTATFTINHGQSQVCWKLEWANIDTPFAAHIHEAPVTDPGPIVLPLSVNPPFGCAENVSQELIKALLQEPEEYYVNVHNAAFPGGAIRGQLDQ